MLTRIVFPKLLFALLGVSLLSSLVFFPAAARAASEQDYVVAATSLNLRSGPGLDHSVLRLLSHGQRISVLEQSENGRWSQVRLIGGLADGLADGQADRLEGWVYSAYIEPVEEGSVDDNAYVLVPSLNLRVGPGLTSRILRSLSQGLELSVTGRSVSSDWLLVKLSDGTTGWVFSPLVATDAEIASLPVMEAYGGPNGSGKPVAGLDILVTIRNNQAVVDVRSFPASADVKAELGLPGESLDLVVAEGETSADGSARLVFEMPDTWSDGSALTEQNLVVVVSTEDGSYSKKASIVYLR